MTRAIVCLLAAAIFGLPPVCHAHRPDGSYLTLRMLGDQQDGQRFDGEWAIALRDLEQAVGLDADLDGAVTWGELRARHDAIAAYALARLDVRSGGELCHLQPLEQLVERHGDGAFSVLRLRLECPRAGTLAVDYRLFFDLDPTHRGRLRLATPSGVRSARLVSGGPPVEL